MAVVLTPHLWKGDGASTDLCLLPLNMPNSLCSRFLPVTQVRNDSTLSLCQSEYAAYKPQVCGCSVSAHQRLFLTLQMRKCATWMNPDVI